MLSFTQNFKDKSVDLNSAQDPL